MASSAMIASRLRHALSSALVLSENRFRSAVPSEQWRVRWHHQVPLLFHRWWSGLLQSMRTAKVMVFFMMRSICG